jgi:hypothetical protein
MSTLQGAEKLLLKLSRAEKAQLLRWVARELADALPGTESTPGVCAGEPPEMTIEEIYNIAIKPLPPSEQFLLATLILNEIPPQSVLDIREAWNEQDMTDVAAYSARLFAAEYPEDDDLVETR